MEELYEEEMIVEELQFNGDFRAKWDRPETLLLIDLYKQHTPQVGKTKRFAKKELIWEAIASQFREAGFLQYDEKKIKNKFTALERGYKNMVDNNRRSGRGRQTCAYQQELEEVLCSRHNINPTYLITSRETVNLSEVAIENSIPAAVDVPAPSVSLAGSSTNQSPASTSSQRPLPTTVEALTVSVSPSSPCLLSSSSKQFTLKRKASNTIAEELRLYRLEKIAHYKRRDEIAAAKLQIYQNYVERKLKILEEMNNNVSSLR